MIRLARAHHVRFAVPDLDACERFCLDFGLAPVLREHDRLFMRGTGTDAFCFAAERGPATELLGLAFCVDAWEDLERAVADHGASPIRKLYSPGGGWGVTLRDPDGMPIDLVHKVADVEPLPLRDDIRYNTASDKSRQSARQHQPDPGPAQIIRFGHAGLIVTDFARSAAWYGEVLGFRLSDGVHAGPDEKPMAGFFRMDRGGELVDHHSLAMFVGDTAAAQHVSFEVQDIEAQLLAHSWLEKRGWSSLWGLGRHQLGSHVFDVWWEPNDIRFETFTDTDVWTAEKPGVMSHVHHGLTRWGPEMPAEYILPRGTPGVLAAPPPS